MHCLNVWLTVTSAADVPEVGRLLAEAARLSRAEPGCLRFEVYHSQADPQRFMLHEHWANKEAWEAHRSERAYTQIYQPQVLPRVTREGHPCTLLD
jgi:quinol monooxygenase YgiN